MNIVNSPADPIWKNLIIEEAKRIEQIQEANIQLLRDRKTTLAMVSNNSK